MSMSREEFEQKFKQGGAWLNSFYNRCVYHLGESPVLFWFCFALAVYGAVRVFV